MTKQHRQQWKTRKAALANHRETSRRREVSIPASVDPAHRLAAIKAAAQQRKHQPPKENVTVTDRDEIIRQLAEMSESEFQHVVNKARDNSREQKQQAALDGLQEYLKGHRD